MYRWQENTSTVRCHLTFVVVSIGMLLTTQMLKLFLRFEFPSIPEGNTINNWLTHVDVITAFENENNTTTSLWCSRTRTMR
jgi:hypothetical protein